MKRQDMNGVRTAQDLERKYNLAYIDDLKRNYEIQKDSLTKVENELNDFVSATTQNLEEIQDQVDGNITTWFSSGVPTLNNFPASDWQTTTDKNNHLGDLYYNKNTGYGYRFSLENNVYSWLSIKDTDVTQALALANAAQDTADSKRRVFVSQPIPPYDVGDLWINNQELYRCQTTKDEEQSYEVNDWIKATKYTDDTVANQVGNNLTILSGTVTEIRDDVDELSTTMTNTTSLVNQQGETIGTLQQQQSQTTQTVNEISSTVSSVSTRQNNDYQELLTKFNDYMPTSDFVDLENSVRQLQTDTYTKTEINTKLTDGSVTMVSTTSGTFDENGLTIEKTNAKTKGRFNEVGMRVMNATGSSEEELLFAGYDENLNESIVRTKNINVTKYLSIGTKSRIEDYEDGIGIFYVG